MTDKEAGSFRTLVDGESVEVGDIIVGSGPYILRPTHHTVHRVTKKYAFIWYNDVAEGKFPRVVDWAFGPRPRPNFSAVRYEVRRPLPV